MCFGKCDHNHQIYVRCINEREQWLTFIWLLVCLLYKVYLSWVGIWTADITHFVLQACHIWVFCYFCSCLFFCFVLLHLLPTSHLFFISLFICLLFSSSAVCFLTSEEQSNCYLSSSLSSVKCLVSVYPCSFPGRWQRLFLERACRIWWRWKIFMVIFKWDCFVISLKYLDKSSKPDTSYKQYKQLKWAVQSAHCNCDP